MSSRNDAAREEEIVKVVYRQLMPGDWRKFKAESNDSDTGGGARDLRFHKFAANELRAMFQSEKVAARRTTTGTRAPTKIPTGNLYWEDAAKGTQRGVIMFEAPTPSRAGEMRLPTVHHYPFFNGLEQPNASEGAAFLLFAAKRNGEIWAYMTTEAGLDHPGWHPAIRPHILACLTATRKGSAAQGFIDLEDTTKSRCNADA